MIFSETSCFSSMLALCYFFFLSFFLFVFSGMNLETDTINNTQIMGFIAINFTQDASAPSFTTYPLHLIEQLSREVGVGGTTFNGGLFLPQMAVP